MLSPESRSPQSQKLMQKKVFPAITKMKYFSQINPLKKNPQPFESPLETRFHDNDKSLKN